MYPPSGDTDPLLELKRDSQRIYSVLAVAVDEFIKQVELGRFPPLGKIKRHVQKMVELCGMNPQILTAFASRYGGKKHQMLHPVNVMILSILVGQVIGLDRRTLGTIGLAAILHDAGMKDADDGSRQDQTATVPDTVHLLTQMKVLNEHTLIWTVAAYEVALYTGHYDLHKMGYYAGYSPQLMSKILAVTHLYERLINAETDKAVAPSVAMLHILQRAKSQLDPLVARAFFSVMGVYPVGTLVELSNGTKAIVTQAKGSTGRYTYPVVRPLGDLDEGMNTSIMIDTGKSDPPLSIVRTIPPKELRINPTAELLA